MKFLFYTITNGDTIRIRNTKSVFRIYSLKNEFVFMKKHPTSGKLGCFESHIHMFTYAKQNNMEYICISEDNINNIPDTDVESALQNISIFINRCSTWEIIILGGWYIPLPTTTIESTVYPSIYKTNSIHGTSCYIIHKRLYLKILDIYSSFMDYHIDRLLMETAKNEAYILYPFLFRRSQIIPTTNLNVLPNSIINNYYSIICSESFLKGIQFYAIHYRECWMIFCFCIIMIILICNKKKM